MTVKKNLASSPVARIRFGTFFLGFILAFLLTMLIKNTELAIQYMQNGLKLCAAKVIPSLFPFMVISELLIASGFGEFLGSLIGAPFSRLFGISRAGFSAVLLGAACGFPVGAKSATSLYDRGLLSRREFERLLTFCNIPSSGFLISVVGVSLFSSRRFGIFLYLLTLISAFVTGLLFRRKDDSISKIPNRIPPSFSIDATTFTTSISNATSAMLSVCAYVVFFSSVLGCLTHCLGTISLSPTLKALLFGFFEISSGISATTSVTTSKIAAVCGFIVGWSGLSVHFQILSFCGGRGISFLPYFLSKLVQGILCSFGAWLYALRSPLPIRSAFLPLPSEYRLNYSISLCLLFLLCILLRYRKKNFTKR